MFWILISLGALAYTFVRIGALSVMTQVLTVALLGAVTSVLNLGVSVGGFAMVLSALKKADQSSMPCSPPSERWLAKATLNSLLTSPPSYAVRKTGSSCRRLSGANGGWILKTASTPSFNARLGCSA